MPTPDITTGRGDAEAVIDAATAAARANVLEAGKTYAVSLPRGGSVEVLDRDLDIYLARPRRKTGTTVVHDADAFTAYWRKHALPESEVYADATTARLVAVLNAHDGPGILHPAGIDSTGETIPGTSMSDDVASRHNAPDDDAHSGWGDHRISLTLHKTTAWKAWEAHDRTWMDQIALAEHFEERLPEFRDPTGADMLELAQTFQASRSGAFSSSTRLSTGEVQLDYREEHQSTAGKAGRLTIPETFDLALVPFEGGSPYKVEARFRYRLAGQQLRVGYLLTRPEEILKDAFLDQVLAVRNGIGLPILNGVPMSARS